MRTKVWLIAVCLCVVAAPGGTASAFQTAGAGEEASAGNVQHILFGDLKISGMEHQAGTITLNVVLQSALGRQIGRIPLPPNGRFRFDGIPNGEFVLIVELESEVVYKEQFLIYEGRSTDVRKDIELMWEASESPAGGTVFMRSGPSQRQFEEAQGALSRGDLKKAADLLQRLVESEPADFEAWTELGTTEFHRERYAQAERAYRDALAVRAGYFPALLNLGKLQVARKQFDAAIPVLEEALQAGPDHAEVNHLLGESYLGIKKGSRAVGFLEAAIRLDPVGKAEVHLRLAQLYDAAGMKGRASTEYRAYLEKIPESPRRQELERYIEANP
jgi:tetratricopeptide (TPR) repeat protein